MPGHLLSEKKIAKGEMFMSRNPKDAPLPAEKFELSTATAVEMTEIDGMEQGAILRFTDAGRSGRPQRGQGTAYLLRRSVRRCQRPAGLCQYAGKCDS